MDPRRPPRQVALAWVSIVLLGGFAPALDPVNFGLLSFLMLLQGIRWFTHNNIVAIASLPQGAGGGGQGVGLGSLDEAECGAAGPAAGPGSDVSVARFQAHRSDRGPPAASSHSAALSAGFLRLEKPTRRLLRRGSTVFYFLRLASYAARLAAVGAALRHNASGWPHNEAQRQAPMLLPALCIYYSAILFACAVYFGATEGWGWYATLWTIRDKAVELRVIHGVEGLEGHKLLLRYLYYLYFKASNENLTAMMATARGLADAPSCEQIVLPWPWVHAAKWVWPPQRVRAHDQ
jgi:hypothetical protein